MNIFANYNIGPISREQTLSSKPGRKSPAGNPDADILAGGTKTYTSRKPEISGTQTNPYDQVFRLEIGFRSFKINYF
jgi:hypothetical protein